MGGQRARRLVNAPGHGAVPGLELAAAASHWNACRHWDLGPLPPAGFVAGGEGLCEAVQPFVEGPYEPCAVLGAGCGCG